MHQSCLLSPRASCGKSRTILAHSLFLLSYAVSHSSVLQFNVSPPESHAASGIRIRMRFSACEKPMLLVLLRTLGWPQAAGWVYYSPDGLPPCGPPETRCREWVSGRTALQSALATIRRLYKSDCDPGQWQNPTKEHFSLTLQQWNYQFLCKLALKCADWKITLFKNFVQLWKLFELASLFAPLCSVFICIQ